MQVSLEKASGLERRLKIIIPTDVVDNAITKRLAELSRTVRIDGFRPGKVPAKLIKHRYGEDVRHDILGKEMQKAFVEAISQEKLNPVASPLIESSSMEEGKDIEFVAVFEVRPEIVVPELNAIKIKQPKTEVKQSDVDELITILQKRTQTFEEVDRPAQNEDQVVFDFTGYLGEEAFEGGSGTDMTLILGSKQMIPGFEEGLLSVSAGEEKEFFVTFPDDYHQETLKGQEAKFVCKIHKIKKAVLPELNDAFFAMYGVNEGGEEVFKQEVEKNMNRELKQSIRNSVKQQALDSLYKLNTFDVPSSMVKQELQRMADQINSEKADSNVQLDDNPQAQEEAKKRVSLGLLIDQLIKDADIKVDTNKVQEKIQELSVVYQNPKEVIDHYYKSPKEMAQLKSLVLEEQVVDYIISNSEVEDVEMSYTEALKYKIEV